MRVSSRRLTWLAVPLLALGFLPGRARADSPPSTVTAPSVSTLSWLAPAPGQTLVASPGTWSGSPALTYSYKWYELDDTLTTCVNTGQSGTTYPLADSDYGQELEVLVTATNSAGSASVMSSPVYIGPSGPTLIAAPRLSGGTHVGDTLTATAGDWSGYPSPSVYAYTWWDCSPSGADCTVANPGSSGPTYTLTAADIGYRIQVTVYVDNGNHASASSRETDVVTRRR